MTLCEAVFGDVQCSEQPGHTLEHHNGFVYWDDKGNHTTFPAQRLRGDNDWDCELQGHLWHSNIISKMKILECDWCVVDGVVRPGYKDPKGELK